MNKVKPIIERLKKLYQLTNNRELSNKLKIKYQTLTTWLQRDKVPYELLEQIAQNENISLDWLLTGKGSMQVSDENSDQIFVNFFEDISASAGYGAINHNLSPEKIEFSTALIKSFNINNIKNIDIIKVYGDSMEPEFKNGEYIVTERVSSIDEVKNGNTVIAIIEDELFIKKLLKDPVNKKIALISSNSFYEPIVIDKKNMHNFNIVAIVRGSFKPI